MSSDCTSGMPALSSVASSWLKTRNSRVEMRRALRQPERSAAPRAPARCMREDVQTLVLEFAAEPRFAVGDVNAFDDFAARGAEPAAEFHGLSVGVAFPAQDLVSVDIIGRSNPKLYNRPAGTAADGPCEVRQGSGRAGRMGKKRPVRLLSSGEREDAR